MFKIVYSDRVKDDLKDIADYISLDNPIYSLKTINSILETVDLLEKFPYIGKEIDGNLRELLENNYKYKIVYELSSNVITILAVYKYKNNWK